jgi:two-component system, LytTR family, response regulator
MTKENQTPIRILIVEDEFITLETLKTVLSEMKYKISGDAMSANEAIAVLEKGETDFAILDINIKGDKDGIWLAKQIKDNYKIPFIFLTAFADDSTVNRAIETEPFGYLVKPFDKVDVFTAIEVALKNFAKQSSDATQDEKNHIASKDSIFIRDDYMFVKIKIKDILFIKSDKNYLEVHMPGKIHLVRAKMIDFAKSLSKNFIQIHRSYVINTDAVERFGAGFLFINDIEIPVGANYKDELKGHFNLF